MIGKVSLIFKFSNEVQFFPIEEFKISLTSSLSLLTAALKIKCLALFMDSPVQAYGKYSNFINVIVPEGETEETTTHDTLGSEKISFEKVLNSSVELLKRNQF